MLEAGVHHGGGLIDASAHPGNDAVDNVSQVGVVAKPHRAPFQFATSFHIDETATVDQYIRHRGVGQQGFQRPEAQHLVFDQLNHALPRGGIQRYRLLFLNQTLGHFADLKPGLLFLHTDDQRKVHYLDQLFVQLKSTLLFLFADHRNMNGAFFRRRL